MFEEIVPLNPVHFFAFSADCHYYKGKKDDPLTTSYFLPDLMSFHGEKAFASLALGWSEKGIYATIRSSIPLKQTRFPDFQSGDAVELFIDTRDVKTSGYNTRFCHHFFFLPEAVDVEGENVQAGEITRFRTEDAHELCDASKLFVTCEKDKKGYLLSLFIPAECLNGYDPSQFDRLGFTYRIYRSSGSPQFFSASSEDFTFEQHPSLWASIKLKKD